MRLAIQHARLRAWWLLSLELAGKEGFLVAEVWLGESSGLEGP